MTTKYPAVLALVFLLGQTGAWASASPAFPLEGLDLVGNRFVRVDPKAQSTPTVVAFLSAKCPCSQSHEATLAKLAAEFPAIKFVAVHSNTDEDITFSKEHFSKARLPFAVIQDAHAKIAKELGAFKTPHVFVISPRGDILFNGGVDDSHFPEKAEKHYLKEALLAIVAGQEPKEKEVRTLGCIIKRD